MAEIAAKAAAQTGTATLSMSTTFGQAVNNQMGEKTFICEVTTGGAETAGTVTFATYFGTLASRGATAVVRGYTIQQDVLTNAGVVAFASWTAAGIATTGTIVASKNYWVVFVVI
jgi:hypothetical protein